ncbi:hypothetical protein CGQ24_09910 [Arthrobacter sp. 7749]|nr:hypothetical protein CGQ24_09910 [Arthrobacter sp. 7749]
MVQALVGFALRGRKGTTPNTQGMLASPASKVHAIFLDVFCFHGVRKGSYEYGPAGRLHAHLSAGKRDQMVVP